MHVGPFSDINIKNANNTGTILGQLSCNQRTICGVAQGSLLGLLLFNVNTATFSF